MPTSHLEVSKWPVSTDTLSTAVSAVSVLSHCGIHTERLCLQCVCLGRALCIATVLYLAYGHNLAPSSSITLG